MTWIVYDPLDADHREYATQAEALRAAEALVETYLDDGSWAEEVTEIRVSQLTHVVKRVVEASRAEMGDEAFEELTGDLNGTDEWWSHHIVPVSAGDVSGRENTDETGGS